jgi:hypothetical protein
MEVDMVRPSLARWLFPFAVSLAAAPPAARADVVTDWNLIAINATSVPPNAAAQSRALAIMHGAIYDAVRAVVGKGAAYAVDLRAPPGASLEAGVAAAAHGVLARLVPAQRPTLDAALKVSLAKVAAGKEEGVRLGAEIAERTLALRADDGAAVKAEFAAAPGPGRYQQTPPHRLPAALPHWGKVRPFMVRLGPDLALAGAPAPDSPAFLRDLDEVRRLGGRYSAARTADQTAAAMFWGAPTPVPWNAIARAAAQARKLSLFENARLFAMLAMAGADSQIVAFAEKYARPAWRPITALSGDPPWEPLLGTPPHPEYPSAHAIYSGAAEAVLIAVFGGDEFRVSVTHPPVFGATRSYARFSEITAEVENARVWAGIHFRSAAVDGSAIGRKIGVIVVRDFPRPARD